MSVVENGSCCSKAPGTWSRKCARLLSNGCGMRLALQIHWAAAFSPACQFAFPAPRTGPPSAIDGAGRPSCESGRTDSTANPAPAVSAAIASVMTGRTRLTVARSVRDVTLASSRSAAYPKPIESVHIAEGRRVPQHDAGCRAPSGRPRGLETLGREPHDLVASRVDLPHEILRPAWAVGLVLVPERDEGQGLR